MPVPLKLGRFSYQEQRRASCRRHLAWPVLRLRDNGNRFQLAQQVWAADAGFDEGVWQAG